MENLKDILNKLRSNNIEYKLDGYIFAAKYYLRHIYFENCDDKGKLKDIIGKDDLKRTKFDETYEWYLGDKRKKLSLRFKDENFYDINDWEKIQTDNYGIAG